MHAAQVQKSKFCHVLIYIERDLMADQNFEQRN